METVEFVNGKKMSKEQLKSELKECEISFNSKTELVRWNHVDLGTVFDTVSDYRKHCGTATFLRDLDVFTPYYCLLTL